MDILFLNQLKLYILILLWWNGKWFISKTQVFVGFPEKKPWRISGVHKNWQIERHQKAMNVATAFVEIPCEF